MAWRDGKEVERQLETETVWLEGNQLIHSLIHRFIDRLNHHHPDDATFPLPFSVFFFGFFVGRPDFQVWHHR